MGTSLQQPANGGWRPPGAIGFLRGTVACFLHQAVSLRVGINGAQRSLSAWALAVLSGWTLLVGGIGSPASLRAETLQQRLPARADLEQKLGAQIPLDLTFTDETGRQVPLRQYFNGAKPVVLQLGYNHCWLMCDVVTGALVRSLQDLRLNPGTDFSVLFVSIDPHETWQVAAKKRAEYIRSYGRSRTGPGWHFLTGQEPQIKALADAVGFHYFYDPPSQQFAHASGIMVCTPTGVMSKYFYGVEFPPSDLHTAILAAGGGNVGGVVETLLMLCYHWNPLVGKYGWIISPTLKALCLGTVAALAFYIVRSLRREARQRRRAEAAAFSLP